MISRHASPSISQRLPRSPIFALVFTQTCAFPSAATAAAPLAQTLGVDFAEVGGCAKDYEADDAGCDAGEECDDAADGAFDRVVWSVAGGELFASGGAG